MSLRNLPTVMPMLPLITKPWRTRYTAGRYVTAELHGTMVSSHAALTAASQPAADPPVLFWGSRRPGGWGTHLLTWAGVLEGPVLPPRIFFSPDFWSKMAHFRGF